MKNSYLFFALVFLTSIPISHSQIFHSNGALISMSAGAVVHCNGGVELKSTTNLTNNGTINITKNATLPNAGNFGILNNSEVKGNGVYAVEQNWINDSKFIAGNSLVKLYGNTEQLITSSIGVTTTFHDLALSGNGVGVNRRKSFVNVGARIDATGKLTLSNRELHGDVHDLEVLNPSNAAISGSVAMNNEGFISNLNGGSVLWNTNSTADYIFPVGSSDGNLRYRPVSIQPKTTTNSVYAVRMNNYSADLDSYLFTMKEPSVETVNTSFYHSIDRVSGEALANIAIAYSESTDGAYTGIAHWNLTDILWKDIPNSLDSPFGNYQSLKKDNWKFNQDGDPYILSTNGEFIDIPNVFSPNGDNVNDVYSIQTKGIQELALTIVNRWGDVVYQTNDVLGKWDGTFNGNKCTDGVYFYVLRAKSKTKEYKEEGHITLIGN